MDQQEMLHLLKAQHELEVQETDERLDRTGAFAMPLARARLLALDPSAASEAEKQLIDTNPHVARLIASFRRRLGEVSQGMGVTDNDPPHNPSDGSARIGEPAGG